MKKSTVLSATALLLAFVFCLFAFAACGETENIPSGENEFPENAKMTLVIATDPVAEYTIDLSGKSKDVTVTSLMDDEGIPYTMSGTMITSAGGLSQSGNVYLYLYTSVEKDKDVSQWMTTIEYKGVTLTDAGVGILDMTVEDGCIIYIGTIVYSL